MRYRLPSFGLAVLVGATACASGGATSSSTSTTAASTKTNTNLISAAEIETVPSVRNAFDIVQRLRPTWLTKAKSGGISMSGSQISSGGGVNGAAMTGTGSGANGGIIVYLDNARMGGLTALSDIPVSAIDTIQFMDPATATALLPGLSTEVIGGAIVVHSRTGK